MATNNPPSVDDREQWDEHDMVYLAVEIFRQRERMHSPLQPRYPAAQILFDSLSNDRIEPNWEELVLPTGRTVSSCRRLFHDFSRRSSGPSAGPSYPQGPLSFPPTISGQPSRKRSYPSEPILTPLGRPIAPKQPATYPSDPRPLLTGHQHLHNPLSPLAEPASGLTETTAKKKRGRPTKAEQEERRKLHQERLQAQSPGLASSFGPTLQQAPLQIPGRGSPLSAGIQPTPTTLMTPRTFQPEGGEHHSSSSSGKKRRGRPPKVDTEHTEPLQGPTFRITTSQPESSAYSSPPHSAPMSASARERRTSISTRSTGTSGPPTQGQRGEESEDNHRQQRPGGPRSWNDTVMGTSNPRP